MKKINSRTKGKVGELEAAKLLRRWFPECQRGIGQARDGAEMPDLINTWPFWVEVKRRRRIALPDVSRWWTKVDMEAAKSLVYALPVLMYRGDRQPWRVRLVNNGKVVDVSWETFSLACDKKFLDTAIEEHRLSREAQ
jgi:hypothetical protein